MAQVARSGAVVWIIAVATAGWVSPLEAEVTNGELRRWLEVCSDCILPREKRQPGAVPSLPIKTAIVEEAEGAVMQGLRGLFRTSVEDLLRERYSLTRKHVMDNPHLGLEFDFADAAEYLEVELPKYDRMYRARATRAVGEIGFSATPGSPVRQRAIEALREIGQRDDLHEAIRSLAAEELDGLGAVQ